MFSNTNHLLPVTMSPIPSRGRHWNLFALLLSLSCIILTTAYHSTTAAASNSNGLTRATWGRVPLPDTRDVYYLHV